jgi:hypothetical protein
MRPVKPEPIRLGPPHCCQCTAARGGICGHIEEACGTCEQHATIDKMRRYEPWPPWWRWPEPEPFRPHEVSWD